MINAMGSSSQMNAQFQQEMSQIPDEIKQQGKEAVREYAEQNGITLPPPPEKQEQTNLFAQNEQSSSGDDKKQEHMAALVSAGVPQSVVAQGKDAVAQYAQENDIELPEPPSAGMNLDLSA